MKVIDLLNKIANGEDVPLINVCGRTLRYNKEEHWFDDINDKSYCRYSFVIEELNQEVEITGEDKKIEKFTEYEIKRDMVTELNIIYKINEIIDQINREK